MKKIFFDTSIHLGQFSISNEETRISCKNSQVGLSSNAQFHQNIGFNTYSDIAAADDTIWELTSSQQNRFYPFLDQLQTDKRIMRIPPTFDDMKSALQMHEELGIGESDALLCAAAIRSRAYCIHTCNPTLLDENVKRHMQEQEVFIQKPPFDTEVQYEETGLEDLYQEALSMLREAKIDLLSVLQRMTQSRAHELLTFSGETKE